MNLMLVLAFDLGLLYLLLGASAVLLLAYVLRKFTFKKDSEEEKEQTEEEIAKEEVERLLVHENTIYSDKDIEKEVARDNYNLEDTEDKKEHE